MPHILTTITEGGLASGGGSDSTTTSSSGNTGGSQKGEFSHGKVDPVEAGKSKSALDL